MYGQPPQTNRPPVPGVNGFANPPVSAGSHAFRTSAPPGTLNGPFRPPVSQQNQIRPGMVPSPGGMPNRANAPAPFMHGQQPVNSSNQMPGQRMPPPGAFQPASVGISGAPPTGAPRQTQPFTSFPQG